MTIIHMARIRTIYYWTCPIPLITFALLQWYVSQYDGWGRWAAAPMLLGPILLSLLQGVMGCVLIARTLKAEQPLGGLAFATMTAGCLAAWYILNLILMELMRSV